MEEYMPAAELEDCFEHAALQGAALLPTEIEFLRIRRRRLSLERAGSDASHDQPASRPCKVVVLGDESSSGKISMLELLCLDPSGAGVVSADVVQASRAGFLPFGIRDLTFRHRQHPEHPQHQQVESELQLWAPVCTEEYTALRPLYYADADVFIVVFSITEPHTLDAVREVWLREIQPCQAQRRVPTLLVGNYGELRQHTAAPGQLVRPDQAVQLAQECEFLKYLEVTSFNPAHIHELFRQAVLATRDTAGAVVTAQRSRAELALCSVLCAPTPSGFFEPWERAFLLDLRGCDSTGVKYLVSWDGTPPTDRSHRYAGKLVMRDPYPQVIQVQSVARCKYRSAVCCFKVPEVSRLPVGHFDAGANRLVLDGAAGTTNRAATAGGRKGECEGEGEEAAAAEDDADPNAQYFYTLDGSEPTAQSQTCGCSWPVVDLASQPKVVRVVAVQRGKLRSPVADFPVPCILPRPVASLVTCNDGSQELTIVLQRGVHYRYTCDGTTPSHCNGQSYTTPVRVRQGVCVKVIALPDPVLPSAVAVVAAAPR
jgi:GTPase SAR1 family protein